MTHTVLLRLRRFRWFEPVSRSDGWINQCLNLDAVGKRGKSQPRKTWDDVIRDDLKLFSFAKGNTVDRVIWRYDVRSAAKASNPCFTESRP